MRRILGLDVNGWRDGAACDWPSELEEKEPTSEVLLREGGTGSVVVKTGDHFVAGPQAISSPIGRGAGWGQIGDPRLRRDIRGLWRSLIARETGGAFDAQFQSVIDALSSGADEIILVVPDDIEFDDERQQRLLDGLGGRRRKPVRLLWRPVAMALAAIADGRLDSCHDGQTVLCVAHSSAGFEVQTLRLRRLTEHRGLLAPERAGPGKTRSAEFGLDALLASAEQEFRNAHPDLDGKDDERPRLPIRALIEEVGVGETEILRLSAGRWFAAKAPLFALPRDIDLRAVVGDLRPEIVLFSSPLNDDWRGLIVEALNVAALGAEVIDLNAGAAAYGAFHAGRRIERGVPHYLDQLEQVSLIVLRGAEPVLDDLVHANAVVPANREYVSKPITNLSWPAGAARVQFYLKKGKVFRKWTVDGMPPPLRDQPLELRLRQTPAQGRARLEAFSEGWDALRSHPILLDWSKLEPETRSFEEIADELRPRPVIPERLTARAHADAWSALSGGLTFTSRLERINVNVDATLTNLCAVLRRTYPLGAELLSPPTPRVEYARLLDYDGAVPVGLSPVLSGKLDAALSRIARHLVSAAAGMGTPPRSNAALLAATWSFGRCPEDLQDCLVDAARAYLANANHPFLAPRSGATAVMFGLGRVVTAQTRLRSVFELLVSHLQDFKAVAALSMLLSRPLATPKALNDKLVNQIAIELIKLLRRLREDRDYQTKLSYALLCVGGLLRYRESDPLALVARSSPPAQILRDELQEIKQEFDDAPELWPRGRRKRLELLSAFSSALDGDSQGINILRDAASLEEVGDSDDE